MPKNILIFSDGTGQRGGLRPDQRLSNVYKMYRAMRPGPVSPIPPSRQVAFYDAGVGTGENPAGLLRRMRLAVESAVGAGLDENVIECYEKIIAYYEPGDRIFLFGFSRGAYTVRAVANVMNLCGVPTRMKDGAPVPRHGRKLRKIASDAVKYVYNHGAGHPRDQEPYYTEREEKGRRFRVKYGSSPSEGEPDVQGNVQPYFIGAFDTVAALRNRIMTYAVITAAIILTGLTVAAFRLGWPLSVRVILTALLAAAVARYWTLLKSQIKYFTKDPDRKLRFVNPLDWYAICKNGHIANWDRKNYDKWLDSGVGFARHALAIDEQRKDFPRVEWADAKEVEKNAGKTPQWVRQVWFAGCHSDVGGSYPEPESRLSDIALDWMVTELRDCAPDIQIREDLLVRAPDPCGLQHAEIYMPFVVKIPFVGTLAQKWKTRPREVTGIFPLHPSVLDRLRAKSVPQMGSIEPYRPPQLADHPQARNFYSGD